MGQAQVIACYLVEAGDRLLVVDPGPDTCTPRLQAAIETLGFEWAAVTDVLLTHIHFDHAGAAWRFAAEGATVHVHPLGLKHLADPERLWGSAARIYGAEGMSSLWGRMEPIALGQLQAWDSAETRKIGGVAVQAVHTPGHAKHHIAWRVGEDVFLGDVGGVRVDGGPIEPPCPPPDIDIALWKESLDKLATLTEVRTAYRSHYGGFEGSELGGACAQLRDALDRWVRYFKEAAQLGSDERAAAFVSRVEGERPAGTSAAYQLANPAFMSVAGLARALATN